MDGILEGVQTLFRSVGSKLHQDVMHKLQEMGILLSKEQEDAIMTKLTSFQDPFIHLPTRYHQDKYIKDHLNYLVMQIATIEVASMFLWFIVLIRF